MYDNKPAPTGARSAEGSIVLFPTYDDEDVLVKCLTFFRTRQIALRVSDARESELRHIRGCSACTARLRGFQRDLGTEPHEALEHDLRSHLHAAPGTGKSPVAVTALFARNLFIAYDVSRSHGPGDRHHPWLRVHDLAHVLHHAYQHDPQHLSAWGAFLVIGISRAAETHAVVSNSVDDAAPLLQALEEGFYSIPPRRHHADVYAQLLVTVIREAPPVVSHTMMLGIAGFAGGTSAARHVATQVLETIMQSHRAAELATAAELIAHFYQLPIQRAPSDIKVYARVEDTTSVITRLLLHERSPAARYEGLDALLANAFEHRSSRAEINGVLIMRTALHNALCAAKVHGISNGKIRDCFSMLMFRDTVRHERRPLLIDTELIAAAETVYPVVYKDILIDVFKDFGNSVDDHYAVLAAAVRKRFAGKKNNKAPHFKGKHGRWVFVSGDKHASDGFFAALAALASENPECVRYLEWANDAFGVNTAFCAAHKKVPSRKVTPNVTHLDDRRMLKQP
jgi:hypothetical protein